MGGVLLVPGQGKHQDGRKHHGADCRHRTAICQHAEQAARKQRAGHGPQTFPGAQQHQGWRTVTPDHRLKGRGTQSRADTQGDDPHHQCAWPAQQSGQATGTDQKPTADDEAAVPSKAVREPGAERVGGRGEKEVEQQCPPGGTAAVAFLMEGEGDQVEEEAGKGQLGRQGCAEDGHPYPCAGEHRAQWGGECRWGRQPAVVEALDDEGQQPQSGGPGKYHGGTEALGQQAADGRAAHGGCLQGAHVEGEGAGAFAGHGGAEEVLLHGHRPHCIAGGACAAGGHEGPVAGSRHCPQKSTG